MKWIENADKVKLNPKIILHNSANETLMFSMDLLQICFQSFLQSSLSNHHSGAVQPPDSTMCTQMQFNWCQYTKVGSLYYTYSTRSDEFDFCDLLKT